MALAMMGLPSTVSVQGGLFQASAAPLSMPATPACELWLAEGLPLSLGCLGLSAQGSGLAA